MNNIFRFFIIAILFCNSACIKEDFITGSGTTIITALSKDSVWIISDSKHTDLDYATGKLSSWNVCKINHTGNIYFSFAGNLVSLNAGTKFKIFDAVDIMNEAISKSKSFDSIFRYFDNKIKSKLFFACKGSYVNDSLYYKQTLLNNVLIEATITTFENKKLKFRFRTYYCSSTNINNIKILEDSSDEKVTIPTLHITGHNQAIFKYLKDHPTYYVEPEKIKEWGNFFIKLEIAATPSDVGLPINIMAVGNDNKNRWIQKNQPCN